MTPVSMHRKIFIVGDIDHESYLKFARKIDRLEDTSLDEIIHIHLMSEGGLAEAALAFYDRVKASPCEIQICGIGMVASAAALVLAAGDHRMLYPNAWVMVHDDTPAKSDVVNLRVSQLKSKLSTYARLEDQWNKLMAESSGVSQDDWDDLHRRETHLTAQECLSYGLIEEIITFPRSKNE